MPAQFQFAEILYGLIQNDLAVHRLHLDQINKITTDDFDELVAIAADKLQDWYGSFLDEGTPPPHYIKTFAPHLINFHGVLTGAMEAHVVACTDWEKLAHLLIHDLKTS